MRFLNSPKISICGSRKSYLKPKFVSKNWKMKKRRIAILVHENDSEKVLKNYLIYHLSQFWQNDGHEVFFLQGTKQFIPADLIILHVDLSVVPDSYLEFAEQYPVILNGKVRDIRKSTYCTNILRPGDDWNGKVIVKTNNNAKGGPERRRAGIIRRVRNKALGALNLSPDLLLIKEADSHSSWSYPIYNQLQDVPKHYFYQPGLIVQKFTPQVENGYFCVNLLLFLGSYRSCIRIKSRNPIVKDSTAEKIEFAEKPHPGIIKLIDKLGFDYGKFDYVIHEGNAILLDANKTIGGSDVFMKNSVLKEQLKFGASAIKHYF